MIANPVGGKLDFQHLKDVHKTLFQDGYDWAGQTHTVEISKGPSAFAPVQHINTHAEKVFGDLAADNHLQGMGREQFLDRTAHHLGEINALHPFREGNGRAQRAFTDEVAGRAGYGFDWSRTTQKEMIDASFESFHSSAKKYRFDDGCNEVSIRRVGRSIILSPRYAGWEAFWATTSSLDDDVVEAVLACNDNVNEGLR